MQDRFKFRYFSGNNNTEEISFTNCYYTNLDYSRLMQCTGLKDIKGKFIYEGDIIKIEYYDYGIKYRIGVVEWEDDGFCVTYHNAKDTKVSGCSLVDIVNGDKQEVISNIYENPELLENK